MNEFRSLDLTILAASSAEIALPRVARRLLQIAGPSSTSSGPPNHHIVPERTLRSSPQGRGRDCDQQEQPTNGSLRLAPPYGARVIPLSTLSPDVHSSRLDVFGSLEGESAHCRLRATLQFRRSNCLDPRSRAHLVRAAHTARLAKGEQR
jgi:hypothetical protein